jgi:flotillin
LLSVSAFKPMIDKILTEAGFAAGPDALTSLTNALAQSKPDTSVEKPPAPHVEKPAAAYGTPTINGEPRSTG